MTVVCRPDVALPIALDVGTVPVPRPAIDGPVRIGLVANGKPRAEALLRLVADGIAERLPVAELELHRKHSAGKVIDPDAAKRMAARCHLIVTGLGD